MNKYPGWHAVTKGMECGHHCGAVYDGVRDGWEPILVGGADTIQIFVQLPPGSQPVLLEGAPSARCPECSARVRYGQPSRAIN